MRAASAAIMDDTVILGRLRKRHIWVPLAWWANFTRISGGRQAPCHAWLATHRLLLCRAVPWLVRLGVLAMSWPQLFASLDMRDSIRQGDVLRTKHDLTIEEGGTTESVYSGGSDCTSFTGFPVPCEELNRIRSFNSQVMPKMREANYRAVRKAMNGHGFPGHVWHVGHACPDPSKRAMNNEEDYGWNLFAQHAVDNLQLGHCLVSCAEALHMGAKHVHCTERSDHCERACPRTAFFG